MQVTGAVPVKPPQASIPVEKLVQSLKPPEAAQQGAAPVQFVPVPIMPVQAGPPTTPPPPAPVKPNQ
jgi:hypothetical protein